MIIVDNALKAGTAGEAHSRRHGRRRVHGSGAHDQITTAFRDEDAAVYNRRPTRPSTLTGYFGIRQHRNGRVAGPA